MNDTDRNPATRHSPHIPDDTISATEGTQVAEAARPMATPKSHILALATSLDLSASYGALLHMTAVMEAEPRTPAKTEEERTVWDGHILGLISALHCVAMQEKHFEPEAAAEIVDSHLNMARTVLQSPALGSEE